MSVNNYIGKSLKKEIYYRTKIENSICKSNHTNITNILDLRIEELYKQDDELIEQINSLQDLIQLHKEKYDELNREYKQLMTNWTTIIEYMKRIDKIEEYMPYKIEEKRLLKLQEEEKIRKEHEEEMKRIYPGWPADI